MSNLEWGERIQIHLRTNFKRVRQRVLGQGSLHKCFCLLDLFSGHSCVNKICFVYFEELRQELALWFLNDILVIKPTILKKGHFEISHSATPAQWLNWVWADWCWTGQLQCVIFCICFQQRKELFDQIKIDLDINNNNQIFVIWLLMKKIRHRKYLVTMLLFNLVVVTLCLKSIGKEIWTKYVGTTNYEQNSNLIRLSIQIGKTWMYVNDLLLCNGDHFYFHFCFHHSIKKYWIHFNKGVSRCLTYFFLILQFSTRFHQGI